MSAIVVFFLGEIGVQVSNVLLLCLDSGNHVCIGFCRMTKN